MKNFFCLFMMVGILGIVGCAKPKQETTSSTNPSNEAPQATPPATTPPATAPTPPVEVPKPALLWESVRPESKAWTAFLLNLIEKDLANDLMQGASDVESFCPRYRTLSNPQRAQFWGMLISAMTKFESGFNPLSRYKESTMGTDPVTGKEVYSEGLLQLSYQDITWAPYCEFDWSKDKMLDAKDPRRTILNPLKNLNCGTRILARQIRRRNKIALTKHEGGAYWSVLITDGKYTRVKEIRALTQKMPGCL